LRITKRRNDWNTAAPLWPLGRGSTTTRATQHQHETPLYERLPGSVDTAWPKVEPETRFRRLGFLILLIGAVFIVLASILDPRTLRSLQRRSRAIAIGRPAPWATSTATTRASSCARATTRRKLRSHGSA
jgi:hypothetical protein